MAMEKLILKSVMYGADKIPDHWFDKIPGGYFKEKESKNKTAQNGNGSNSSRRHSMSDGRSRREADRYRSDGYRTDGGRRRDRRDRSSYDGGADDDDDEYYRSGDDRRRPARDRPRRRRSFDDDQYDNEDRRNRRAQNEGRPADRRSRYAPEQFDDRDRPSTGGSGPPLNPFSPNAHIPTVAPVGSASMPSPTAYRPNSNAAPPGVPSPQVSPPPTAGNESKAAKSYVPYANIYGRPAQNAPPSPPKSPPDSANPGSPVAPPPSDYQQNPFAQQAPTATEAGAGVQYTGQPGFVNPTASPRYSARLSKGHDSREDDRRSRSERRNDPKAEQDRARAKFVDADMPLDEQFPTREQARSPPDERRKDDRYNRDPPRHGRTERRDRRRRDQGYYSD